MSFGTSSYGSTAYGAGRRIVTSNPSLGGVGYSSSAATYGVGKLRLILGGVGYSPNASYGVGRLNLGLGGTGHFSNATYGVGHLNLVLGGVGHSSNASYGVGRFNLGIRGVGHSPSASYGVGMLHLVLGGVGHSSNASYGVGLVGVATSIGGVAYSSSAAIYGVGRLNLGLRGTARTASTSYGIGRCSLSFRGISHASGALYGVGRFNLTLGGVSYRATVSYGAGIVGVVIDLDSGPRTPIDWETTGLGPYGAIPQTTIDFCDGPLFLSIPQDDQYTTRWAAWQATDGIRIARRDSIARPDGLVGTLTGLYDGETVERLSLCFEQNAKPVIAVERSGGVIEVRRFVGASPVSFFFAGKTPLMFYNGVLVAASGDSDAVCYYLDDAGTQVLMRVQRDNFATEYVVAEGWASPLMAINKVDRKLSSVFIWGYRQADNRKDSRQVVLCSGQYGSWPNRGLDSAGLSVSFASGVYYSTVVGLENNSEDSTISIGFLDGAYQSIVVSDSEDDAGVSSVTFESGAYTLVVVTDATPNDDSTNTVSFQSGQYIEIVIPGSVPSEAPNLAVGFLSGIYAAA